MGTTRAASLSASAVTASSRGLFSKPSSARLAIALAGVCFVLHHTVAMSVYFDWQANALASLGIFIGHMTWSVLYLKYRNIYAGYVSHIFADIGVFVVGYIVAFEG